MYGSKFIDMWKANDISEVKKCWADELRIFSIEQIGIAVDNLKTHNFPPTLPEFLQLCEQARRERPRNSVTALPQRAGTPQQTQEWHDAKARCLNMAKSLFNKPASNAWAHRILKRNETGEHLPADSLRMARNAMRFEAETI